ncbi:DUF6493 family protein [Streptomonospora sediminis]
MNLIELVEARDRAGVLQELASMTLEQRAACAAELAARREATERPASEGSVHERNASWAAAELAGQTTPETAAAWVKKHVGTRLDCGLMVDTTDLYPPEWRRELVARLAEQPQDPPYRWFVLAEHIIRDLGCPLPTTDTFVYAWWLAKRVPSSFAQGWRSRVLGGPQGATLLERLRNDDFTPTLLPLVVLRPAIAPLGHHRKAILQLAAKGVIDRADLSRRTLADLTCDTPAQEDALKALAGHALTPAEQDRVVAARRDAAEPLIADLLQDGARDETADSLTTLRSLALAPDENTAFLRDHVAMLDLSSPVAGYGQEVLTGLDEAGLLEADVLTEACERVLLRQEKKLVRAQLTWLDKVARRDPARAERVLIDAAMVFQHPAVDLQERALKLIARHLRKAGADVLPELRTAAAALDPAHAARAAELLGLPQDTGAAPYTEALPPVPAPRPVPGPIATAAEAAQEVAAVLANDRDVVAFERALDGLVRLARRDRGALSAALAPVVRQEERRSSENGPQADLLYDMAAAVCRAESLHPRFRPQGVSPSGKMLEARVSEAAELVASGSQPFLLALPSLDTGAIDAAVLVERIAEFERLGAAPAPVDLAQALLRVDPAPEGPVLRAAEKLQSDAGRQLAQWLRDGGPAHQDSTPAEWPVADPAGAPSRWWQPAHPGPAAELPLPPVAAALLGPYKTRYTGLDPERFWLAQLPHHRDEAAARMRDISRPDRILPFLVESGGPAGFAVHWKIAEAMGTDTAADALLVLAAQGRLDSGLLGGQLQALAHRGRDGANPAATTLRTAAETGAYATVWSVVKAALPALLGDKPVRGAAALLALAAECASRCGATGPIAEVDEMAGRKGTTQTIKNARLLRDALHREETTPA